MSNNTGGPAFPVTSDNYANPESAGMTLRDWMAGMAMQGICASGPDISNPVIAAEAYALADAMLRAREASNGS